ncbi:hypothetical protein [Streptomyces sp. NBC_01340]|uniref:hypothetical protein n=1 Tax=Streptomyces sp. NBC_01340 TaxID=2903830 RepID=UPI002E0EBD8D
MTRVNTGSPQSSRLRGRRGSPGPGGWGHAQWVGPGVDRLEDGSQVGGSATWIGFAMGDDCTEELASWASAGGSGIAEPPVALELQFVRPPREARARTRR